MEKPLKILAVAGSLALLLIAYAACSMDFSPTLPQAGTTGTVPTTGSIPTTVPVSSVKPSVPATQTPPPPTTTAALQGWQELPEGRCYLVDGVRLLGWQDIDGKAYYFDEAGIACTGWLRQAGATYYLGASGERHSGWLDLDGKRYFLDGQGLLLTGWQTIAENDYCFDGDGVMLTGWLEGRYLRSDGRLAKGRVEIDGKTWFFTSTGQSIVLVNPWNSVPEDYSPTIVYSFGGGPLAQEADQPLRDMLAACQAAGNVPFLCSAYRSHELQQSLYANQVQVQLSYGYSYEEAVERAGQIVAMPGTSEHELGLAVDIMDFYYQVLDEKQADTPTQKWLMEHCWEYGFVLRYPVEDTALTGITYEPWHYRYVGKELARELRQLDMCLEEYIQMLTEESK